ncbi:MAG: class I SAM-dependent methyltransferase [Herpetosiphon sp.]
MNLDYTIDAPLYDLVYADYDEDIAFYVAEARRAHGPCLELGCGTGRILVPVAQAGVDVTGLELSDPMVARAQKNVAALPPDIAARVSVVQGDMRNIALDRRFALIYIPFRAFLHLLQVGDQLAALASIHRHLLPGGRLALNFFDPSLEYIVAHSRIPQGTLHRTGEEFIDPETGHVLIEWASVHYDQLNQRIDQYFVYDEVNRTGRVVRRLYREVRMRYIFRWEFEHLLHRCGFEVEALYGSFERDPILQPGNEFVWIARATP